MIPIVTPEEMGAIDRAAPEPVEVLIGRAGFAVARAAVAMLGGAYGRRVVLVAGRGNNGNDGRMAAQHLRRRGAAVTEFAAGDHPAVLSPADLLIDAAYGTGFHGRWDPPDPGGAAVLAVDLPSGLDALTGDAEGEVIDADLTVCFQALKPGLLFGRGAAAAGSIDVVDIGLDTSSARAHLLTRPDVAGMWPLRRVDDHKWRGAVRVVGGSDGMTGAPRLAAEAAARAGAGLVSVSSPAGRVDASPELLSPSLPAEGWADAVLGGQLARFGALVVGPGLGRGASVASEARRLVAGAPCPLVVDGDGLFALSEGSSPEDVVARRRSPTVLTPHDGEFARLTGNAPAADRIAAVREAADRVGCTVLLKGPTTVVADPTGEVLVVDHGDERLATGDVLSGVIAAALARGATGLEAAAAGAWLHADAAHRGPASGLVAGDVTARLPEALAGLWEGSGEEP
jgi:hydroxyethylthiazole kinase-like uncharacterized protein yjeF